MPHTFDALITALRTVIESLGRDGGQMGPSIYDTAQVLRFLPTVHDIETVEWLLQQQQADGGWGNPTAPYTREVPTLATLLALQRFTSQYPRVHHAVQHGLHFIFAQESHWKEPLPDNLPVAVELLLPCLLREAKQVGWHLPVDRYSALFAFGDRRLQYIRQMRHLAATPVVHSWEAWGEVASPTLLDTVGGVGLSPAATAAWLRRALGDPSVASHQAAAIQYLARAGASTQTAFEGVQPLSWPINRFEQAFGLYALLIAGLLDHPALLDVVQPQLDALFRALGPGGLGFSDGFQPDGDDTAVAIAVLKAAGYPVTCATLQEFAVGDHFCTWPQEHHPALSVTAHAVHALAACGLSSTTYCEYMLQQQRAGRWLSDKWNTSWLYTSSQVMAACHAAGESRGIAAAVDVLSASQMADGGWGERYSTLEETAYAFFALDGSALGQAVPAAAHAARWLIDHWDVPILRPAVCWLSKDVYRPPRIARMFELAATLKGWLTYGSTATTA